jgi:hypothetical protein
MKAVAAKLAKNGNGSNAELLSISKIAMRCGLDRATCRKRLDIHAFQPAEVKEKEKLYLFDAAMEAALTESQDKLTDVKIRKETAAAQIAEIKVKQQMGELAPVGEFMDTVQRLFGAMHKEIAVRLPKQLAARLAKAKTPAETSRILSVSINKVFTDLRDDHQKFLVK